MAFKFKVASTSDCPPDKNCSNHNTVSKIIRKSHFKASIRSCGVTVKLRIFKDTCHDSGDSWGNSCAEEPEGVIGDLGRRGLVLGLGSRGNHARLEEDTLKEDIVLSKVEENLGPNLPGNLESPVNAVLTVKQDLWLNNWDQSIVLKNRQKKKKSLHQLKTHPSKDIFVC